MSKYGIPDMQCIEFIPGVNHYVVPEKKEPEAPDNFIDTNTYHYRLVSGAKVFRCVALGYGWENQRFNPTCEKGEIVVKEDPDWDAILEKTLKLSEEKGLSLYKASKAVAEETGYHQTTIYNKVNKHRKREQQPESAPQQSNEFAKENKKVIDDAPDTPQEDGFTAADDLPVPYFPVYPEDKKTVWNESMKNAVRRLKKIGWTHREIADQVGLTYGQVKSFFERERAKNPQLMPIEVFNGLKAKWIRDIMLTEDIEPGMQLQIVGALQELELPE